MIAKKLYFLIYFIFSNMDRKDFESFSLLRELQISPWPYSPSNFSPLIDHYSYAIHTGCTMARWSGPLTLLAKILGLRSPCLISQKKSYLKFALLISSRILLFVSFCTASSVFFEYFPFIAHSSRIECSKHAFWKSESTVQKKILITKVQNCSVKVHVLWGGRKNMTKSPSWLLVYWSLFTE